MLVGVGVAALVFVLASVSAGRVLILRAWQAEFTRLHSVGHVRLDEV